MAGLFGRLRACSGNVNLRTSPEGCPRLGRRGEPEELAKAVLFLASYDSSYTNAIELVVDGGATGAPSELGFFAANGTRRASSIPTAGEQAGISG
jgi:hypothetical protein